MTVKRISFVQRLDFGCAHYFVGVWGCFTVLCGVSSVNCVFLVVDVCLVVCLLWLLVLLHFIV
jgi:hypothetical protein